VELTRLARIKPHNLSIRVVTGTVEFVCGVCGPVLLQPSLFGNETLVNDRCCMRRQAAAQTGSARSDRPSVCDQTCEHDILKRNEPISMPNWHK